MVLYLNGIPAAVFFIGFFAAVLWQTRRARGMAGLWLHTVPLIALPQIGVYGWLPVELQVVMVASALAYRFCWQPTALPQAAAPLPAGAAGRGVPAHRSRAAGLFQGRPSVSRRDTPSVVSPETAGMARGSVINLVAMASGAALTLALTVLVSRWLQPAGAGALFELIALFTIASQTLELGADTGLMRWISRARAVGGLDQVRRLVPIALLPVAAAGVAAAAAIWVVAPELAHIFLHGLPRSQAAVDIRIVAPLVPLGALSACLLSTVRGASAGDGPTWPSTAWACRSPVSSSCS